MVSKVTAESMPTFEEVTIPEINLTYAPLLASSKQLATYCRDIEKDFMDCRFKADSPVDCLEKGRMVTYCATEYFMQVKAHCPKEFDDLALRIQTNRDGRLQLAKYAKYCRAFDDCVKDKLGLRPLHEVVEEENKDKPKSSIFFKDRMDIYS